MSSTDIHILVIDDEQDLCEITKNFLEMHGEIMVDTAYSAEGARNILAYKGYDAIISDYRMPGENGVQFLTSLRAAGDRTPFILFTCKEREGTVIEALNNGANGFLQKGGDVVSQYKELENMVQSLVQQKRAEDALRDSEVRFRDLVEMVPAAIFEMDLSGKLTFLNQFALELFGLTQKEYADGVGVMDIVFPEDHVRALESIQEMFKERKTGSHRYTGQKRDGTTFSITITSAIILRQGHPVGLRGVINGL
jgi:PAS domain S-box-containing protein